MEFLYIIGAISNTTFRTKLYFLFDWDLTLHTNTCYACFRLLSHGVKSSANYFSRGL